MTMRKVAHAVGARPAAVCAWMAAYRNGGPKALKAKPDIKPRDSRLGTAERAELERALREGARAFGFRASTIARRANAPVHERAHPLQGESMRFEQSRAGSNKMTSGGYRAVGIPRGALEGAGAGIMAGIVYAASRMLASAAMHHSPLDPFRLFASVVLGPDVFSRLNIGLVVSLGIPLLLTLSFGFGLVYGLLETRFAARYRNAIPHALLGASYGLGIWLVNYHLIAPNAYPWFLHEPQALVAVLHTVCFGVPLGLFYAAARHRDEERLSRPATA